MLIRAFNHYEKQILQLKERELKNLLRELMDDDSDE